MSNILIWGAGNIAQIFINLLDIENNVLLGFVDNNTERVGENFYDIANIIEPDVVRKLPYDILIICASDYKNIEIQCVNMEIKNVYSYKDVKEMFEQYPNIFNKRYINWENKEEIWKECIYLAVKQTIKPIIESYREKSTYEEYDDNGNFMYVWSCWWQGEKNVPLLVKKCFESIRDKLGTTYKFIVIDRENYHKYIEIPHYILEKVDRGYIKFNEFSTIIRTKLLKKFGGLWIDATIYIPDMPDYKMEKFPFYSIKREQAYESNRVIPNSWMSAFMKADKYSFLMDFLESAWLFYWKNKNSLIVFHLYSYMIRIAYDEFPQVRKLIDDIPLNNLDLETLNIVMDKAYDAERYNNMRSNTYYFKLTNRRKYEEYTAKGELTYWGAFVRDII